MKFFVIVFIFVTVAVALATETRDLQQDLKDFVDLIPVDELKEITCKYKDDEEVQKAVKYLRSEEFAGLVANVREKESWISFKKYLTDAGVDVEKAIKFVHDIITNGVCKDVPPSERSLKGLVTELRQAIPKEELKVLFDKKIRDSPEFKEFFEKISSAKSRQLVEEVIQLEEFQRLLVKLKELAFDTKKMKDCLYAFFGWQQH